MKIAYRKMYYFPDPDIVGNLMYRASMREVRKAGCYCEPNICYEVIMDGRVIADTHNRPDARTIVHALRKAS